ncbi:MAG: hypothetical protein E7428_01230 [Ruminococcaceae bacterium]|nr:hypothetical protein [Oscillospiraceae bacterium]
MPNFNLKLYNFEKEGKGVEVDEKKPLGVFQVFILYFRYFWKMTLYNVIQFVNLLPIVSVMVAMAVIMMGSEAINELIAQDRFQTFNQSYPWVMICINVYYFFSENAFIQAIGMILFVAAVLCVGPLSAGFFYAARNTTREEHVFTSDIFSQAWENRKQAILVGLLDVAASFAVLIYFTTDFSYLNYGYGQVMGFLKYFALLIYVFYLVIRVYVYTIMVTFDMPLKEIFKAAILLTYSHLPRSLVIWFTMAAVVLANLYLPLPSLLLVPLLDLSLVNFISGFMVYKPIDKYMIQPALKEQNQTGEE